MAHPKADPAVDDLTDKIASLSVSPTTCAIFPTKPALSAVARAIKAKTVSNIIVMTGAGISVAAGIPDFRTPGTGLYDNLAAYNLPFPEAIFELDYFRASPQPFFTLAKEMLPGTFRPTVVHFFCALLAKKGLLLRQYTQNIDTLERVAGVPPRLLVEAHGSFGDAHCIDCKASSSMEVVRRAVHEGVVPKCDDCQGLVKPDIVFFGESLPKRFFDLVPLDFEQADLLLVLGTSLSVRPFSTLIDQVPKHCPRVLFNREKVGERSAAGASCLEDLLAGLVDKRGFEFEGEGAYRDVYQGGDVQESIRAFAKELGWEEELDDMVKNWSPKVVEEKDEDDNDAVAPISITKKK